ncbi:MAG: maleylpyruvate isomerase family mycothiol-dependent enzyme [Acidimicrobiales bacterium]
MEIWDAERDEMLDLAGRLALLDDEQWNSPSLCAQWRIRDVLAHVTAGAEGAFGVGAIVRGMLRHGFNYNRWVAADGQARGQQDPAVVLEALRNAAADRTTQSGTRPVRGLMHVLIHGQDMCRPLGIRRDLPETHLVPVADFVKDDVHIFGAKRRIARLKLTATDMDWSHGDGPEVTGPAEALVMMMAGRSVALDDLSGEGKAALASRP